MAVNSLCPNCSKPIYRFFNRDYLSGDKFDIVLCAECGLLRTQLPDRPFDLGHYYPQEYYGVSNLRFHPAVEYLIRLFRKHRARMIKKLHPKPGRILDVGCGRGIMLDILRRQGWESIGTEHSMDSSFHAREVLRLPVVVNQNLRACNFPSGYFDVITLWHVLEHLADPVEAVNEVDRILKPGGLVLIEVPNIDSLQAKIGKGRWFHLDAPRHLYHFSSDMLRRILKKSGLVPIRQATHSLEFGLYGMIQTLLNRISPDPNFLYTLLKNRSGRRRINSLFKFVMNLMINLVAIIPAILIGTILGLIGVMIGKGGVITIVVKKE